MPLHNSIKTNVRHSHHFKSLIGWFSLNFFWIILEITYLKDLYHFPTTELMIITLALSFTFTLYAMIFRKNSTLFSLMFFYIVWIGLNSWISFSNKIGNLLFLNVLLLFNALWIAILLIKEFEKSYLNQSFFKKNKLQKPIAKLRCQVMHHETSLEFFINKIDPYGVSLLLKQNDASKTAHLHSLYSQKTLALKIILQHPLNQPSTEISCQGRPMTFNQITLGIEFLNNLGDFKKELHDFIELIQTYGYLNS